MSDSEPIDPNANTLSSPAILLLGEPGAGKTFSLATAIRPNTDDRLVYLYTDPGGDESLMDALEYYKVPLRQVYFRHVPPASQGWSGLLSMADQINKFNPTARSTNSSQSWETSNASEQTGASGMRAPGETILSSRWTA